MKLLLDENLSRRLILPLQPYYPGTSQVVLLGLEAATDKEAPIRRIVGTATSIANWRGSAIRAASQPVPYQSLIKVWLQKKSTVIECQRAVANSRGE